MHELTATQNIIQILLQTTQERHIVHLNTVELEVGELTTYVAPPFIQYYDLFKKQHLPLQNSTLSITMIPGKILCSECKKETLIKSEIELFCMHCGSGSTTIIQGNDVIIKNIRVGE